jgi:hypothetical protein
MNSEIERMFEASRDHAFFKENPGAFESLKEEFRKMGDAEQNALAAGGWERVQARATRILREWTGCAERARQLRNRRP